MSHLPEGFLYLESMDPTIVQDMVYSRLDNFIGRPLAGYFQERCIVSKALGEALCSVQREALSQNLSLLVYDAYRPLRAVEDFVFWSKNPQDNQTKKNHYPNIHKQDFFDLGYVGVRSAHCRGAAVDLTLVKKGPEDGPLDMGTPFDFMDILSHTGNTDISLEGQKNRQLLCDLMHAHGFENYPKEWWHFNLKTEPFPHTYFDFPVI